MSTCCASDQYNHEQEADGLQIKITFVALALCGLVLGSLAEWLGWPAWLLWMGYGTSYVFGGWFGLREGYESVKQLHVDIDLLMVLAALGALAIGAPFEGATLLFLFSLSHVLQHVAIGRSRQAIRALMKLRPEEAALRRGAEIVAVPVEEVGIGEVYVLKPGDRLPLDGIVVRGQSEVDQSSLTGESVPVAKSVGEEVFGGTINGAGALDVRVTKLAGESAIARTIQLVEEAQSEKAETQRVIERFEQPYALGVIGLTIAACLLPPVLFGEGFPSAFYRAMTLMVAASPCALVISTPAAVLSGIAAGARNGVLFKGGVYMEQLATVRAIAFDKTGTLTEGTTSITDVVALESVPERTLLALSAGVQAHSEHHLARATIHKAKDLDAEIPESTEFRATIGKGVSARIGTEIIHLGNRSYYDTRQVVNWSPAEGHALRFEQQAQTAIVVVQERDNLLTAIGVLAFADNLRSAAPAVIKRLKAQGIEHISMLTGDNADVAEQMAKQAGVDEFHAGVLPAEKVTLVRELNNRYSATAMIGDGVNDAPALASATVGVAMGAAGTDVALETADLVLMADDLTKLPFALELSKRTRRALLFNLGFSLAVILVMVVCILTIGVSLPLAVLGHEGSTVLVSLNGLRLLGFQPD